MSEPVVAVLADERPDLAEGLQRLVDTVGDGRFDPAILALCRGRMATLLRCEVHAAPLPPDNQLDARARACVDFSEAFVLDHHGITDEQAATVVGFVGPAGMVAFTAALAVYEGICRFERSVIEED